MVDSKIKNEEQLPLFFRMILAPFLWYQIVANKWSGVFKPLEIKILNTVLESLPRDRRNILEDQLNELNLAKRTTAGTSESCFYRVNMLGAVFERRMYFESQNEDALLSSVTFIDVSDREYKASLWIVNGRFFSIEFDGDVSKILDQRPLVNVSIE